MEQGFADYFNASQQEMLELLSSVDKSIKTEKDLWKYQGDGSSGGGEAITLRGDLIEKAAVNYSCLSGCFPLKFRSQIKGSQASKGKFSASGVSIIVHPRSPLLPAFHFNQRLVVTDKAGLGGAFDINPMLQRQMQPQRERLIKALEEGDLGISSKTLKSWRKAADDYFYLPHRKRARGSGGIFFEHLPPLDNSKQVIQNIKNLAFAYLKDYLLDGAANTDPDLREEQSRMRAYYAEFNLIYDRGTKFGLMSGGNPKAILASLPPLASWA